MRLSRDGEKGGKGVYGERGIIYLSLYCHHQNDFCVQAGSGESHFNVSVEVILVRCRLPIRGRSSVSVGGRVQELCESRGGRPGLSVLMSLMVSVDVKQH